MEASSTEKKRRATRADVARLAGVSTAVVSYVFNNGPRPVAADTAQQVREQLKRCIIAPIRLHAPEHRVIEDPRIVVPDLSQPVLPPASTAHWKTAAARNGYSTLFMASHQNPEKEMDRISQLIAREVDASSSPRLSPLRHWRECHEGVSVHLHGSDPAGSRREMRIDRSFKRR